MPVVPMKGRPVAFYSSVGYITEDDYRDLGWEEYDKPESIEELKARALAKWRADREREKKDA